MIKANIVRPTLDVSDVECVNGVVGIKITYIVGIEITLLVSGRL